MTLPSHLVRLYLVTPSISYPPAYWFVARKPLYRSPLRQYCVRRDNHGDWYGYKLVYGSDTMKCLFEATLPVKMTEKLVAIAMLSKKWSG